MSLSKQAQVLKKSNISSLLSHVKSKRHAVRNEVIVLLSIKAGLRAKEIAALKWSMLLNPEGCLAIRISLTDIAAKGKSGRSIPINRQLRQALENLIEDENGNPERLNPESSVIRTERRTQTSPQVIVNLFQAWYHELGLIGCSSHSGRRTFITNAARKITSVGGSLRDVQALAGHSSLNTTQRYIEYDNMAQAKVVDLI